MKVSTKSGFACEFNVDALNDWELHEILLDNDDLVDSRFARAVMKKCMSPESVQKLKDHVRTDSGRIPADAIVSEMMEILQQIKSEKNS